MKYSNVLCVFLTCVWVAVMGCGGNTSSENQRFQVPAGFSVEVAAAGDQTGSLIAFTFDSLGRPVVSKERGHPTILIDKDGDGVFETQKVFSDKVRNLQGLWFDGRTLYAVGNDSAGEQAGLYRLEDTDGDDTADTSERINTFDRGMGEHGPHDIRRGPDGHPTIMLGNHTFVPQELIEPSSPLRGYEEWQLLDRYMDARGHAANIMAPGGVLVRLLREPLKYVLLLGGFRNAYNHAYNWEGEAFTFDSDMEWDINLPWYRPVRTIHAVPGADYGWRTGSGKFPNYYLDTLPPVREAGRGSPVGVEFYHHNVYPKEYFDAYLEGDWSRGRILISHPAPDGATYKVAGEPNEFVHGEPLNVTDVEVGPDGFVYFTMGGRDTEGGFYRVRYTPGFIEKLFSSRKAEGILAVVRQPQPLSSWGYEALRKAKESMGDSWGAELQKLARDASADTRDRVQALLLLQQLTPRPNADLLRPLSQDRDPRVRAAAIYVVGLHGSDRAKAIAASGLKDADPFVRRRAAEAVVRMGLSADKPSFAPVSDVYALLNDTDRFVRYAGRLALERIPRGEWKDRVLAETNPLGAIEGMVALVRTAASEADLEPVFEQQISMLKQPGLSAEDSLRLLRAFHIAAIEAKDGARPTLRKQVHDLIAPRFPGDDDRLNAEYARTLAYCAQPDTAAKILAAMPKEDEKSALQIHYVYCLRTIRQGWTKDQILALTRWFQKASEWRGGASFPGFINRLFDSSLEFFDEDEKKQAYARLPEFAPMEEDALAALKNRRGFTPARVFARKKGVQGVSAEEIYEFQMFDPMTLKGKPENGRKIFEAECASCHRFGDVGKDFGPDLTTINSRFKRKDILEATLWPSKTISDQYQSYIFETKDNDLINALLVSEDDRKVVLKTAEIERPIELAKSQIKGRRVSKISIMPEKLLDGYQMSEISDLMAYIQAGPGKVASE